MSPGSSGGHSLPSGSMILHVAAGRGFAHGARPHFEAGVVADEQGVLRLAVAVVDGQAVQLFPALYDRRVQRLPGRDGVPDGGEVGALQLGGLGEEAVLGRGLAEDGDVVALYEVQALARGRSRPRGRRSPSPGSTAPGRCSRCSWPTRSPRCTKACRLPGDRASTLPASTPRACSRGCAGRLWDALSSPRCRG